MIRAAVLCLIASPAMAMNCAPHDKVTNMLGQHFGELVVMMGMLEGPAPIMFEVFTNQTTGTFTVIITNAQGTSCMPLSGKGLHVVAPGVPS